MILLADAAVAVAEVAVDAAPAGDMVAVVRAGKRGSLRDPEVRFDGIEPGGIGRRGHRVDVQAPEQRQEARMIMDVRPTIHPVVDHRTVERRRAKDVWKPAIAGSCSRLDRSYPNVNTSRQPQALVAGTRMAIQGATSEDRADPNTTRGVIRSQPDRQ